MDYSIKAINLGDGIRFNHGFDIQAYYDVERNLTLSEISPLSKINIFVGPNNSGKSRFLRALACAKTLEYQLANIDIQKTLDNIRLMFNELKQLPHLHESSHETVSSINIEFNDSLTQKEARRVQNLSGTQKLNSSFIFDLLSKLPEIQHPFFNTTLFQNLENLSFVSHWLTILRDKTFNIDYQGIGKPDSLSFKIPEIINKYTIDIDNLVQLSNVPLDLYSSLKRYYIPTFRTLNQFNTLGNKDESENFIEGRVRQIFFKGRSADDPCTFTGQSLYHDIRKMLLGDHQQRQNIQKFEEYLKTEYFENQEITLTPRIDSDVIYVKIGEETEKAIYELGDAIQQIIVMTFPIFQNFHEPVLFFIEEPEINLHPYMQRKFMEVIQKSPKHQFFITTHSNHLLDLTLDYSNISVFGFQKKLTESITEQFYVTNIQGGDSSVLSLIGVQNSSVFLTNCTIWVEGITDRLYFRKYLQLYQDELNRIEKFDFQKHGIEEDRDYTFVEYSGGNIAHWSFERPSITQDDEDNWNQKILAKKLSQNILLIVDQDGGKKLARKEQLKKHLGKHFFELACNEVENLLSPETIFKVLKHYEKAQFILDISGFKYEDYKQVYLGQFIEDYFRKQGYERNRKAPYSGESGTIHDKTNFCKYALEDMTFSDMSVEAIRTTKKIYEFILENKYGKPELPNLLKVETEEESIS